MRMKISVFFVSLWPTFYSALNCACGKASDMVG